MASFGDLKSAAGLKALNEFLADKSYIDGYVPTTSDTAILSQLGSEPSSYPHALRWYAHVSSFSAEEKKAFQQGNTTAEAAPSQKQAKVEDDDSDDLFGDDDSDDEEETPAEKAKREKMEAEKKKAEAEKAKKKEKKPVVGKSEVVLDVKPWDDETDMAELERLVRTIAMEGLVWGSSKQVPVGYGINKLRITCVVVDDLVSTDDIEDQIVGFEDHVQSMDIFAFNKI